MHGARVAPGCRALAVGACGAQYPHIHGKTNRQTQFQCSFVLPVLRVNASDQKSPLSRDYNCDSTALRLRHDYDEKLTC